MTQKTLKIKSFATLVCVIPSMIFLSNTLLLPAAVSVLLPPALCTASLFLDWYCFGTINYIESEKASIEAARYEKYRFDLSQFLVHHRQNILLKILTAPTIKLRCFYINLFDMLR